MPFPVYVESGAGMAYEDTTVAWVFDIEFWGVCGQGTDEASALAALRAETNGSRPFSVVERIVGDELAFARDFAPVTDLERATTVEALAAARAETLALVQSCPDPVLDYDDPNRTLPAFASWRTLRQMAWHIADTESRYYVPALGLPALPRSDDLLAELSSSVVHVRSTVESVPADAVSADGRWTATKVLRRLAWHERSELRTMRKMAESARAALGMA